MAKAKMNTRISDYPFSLVRNSWFTEHQMAQFLETTTAVTRTYESKVLCLVNFCPKNLCNKTIFDISKKKHVQGIVRIKMSFKSRTSHWPKRTHCKLTKCTLLDL